MSPVQPVGLKLRVLLLCIAILAVVLPAAIVATAKPIAHPARVHAKPVRVVPQAELPPVEPVEFRSLSPDQARAYNADVPFSTDPNPAARPFRLAGDDEQRARALDCMAAAVLYEAGDDTLGQRAVAQVVINRVRHPAFPKTICGVVFQGSERSTGCQFTFTCDGALASHAWSDAAWTRARQTATLALTGSVFKPVGYATHYHTDWVVPYWQSSLDKVAAVHTHLFFRWTGWWGTPPAFNRRVSSDEPVIAALAPLSDAHNLAAALLDGDAALAEAAAAAGTVPQPIALEPNTFLVALDAGLGAPGFAILATTACGDRPYCKFMGWTDRTKLPSALPLTLAAQAAMSFSYLRDRTNRYDKPLWNCAQFKRADPAQCMKSQIPVPMPRVTGTLLPPAIMPAGSPVEPVAPAAKVPDGLSGVRRRGDVPAAAPAAAPPRPVPSAKKAEAAD